VDDHLPPETENPPFWTKRRAVVVCCILAAIVALSVGGFRMFWVKRGSPEQAVASLASAAMRGDADSVAASIDTTSIADAAVDEVLSTDADPRGLISGYLKTHPGVTKEQIKQKARSTLDQEVREHVKSGTLPNRIPIGSDSLKALVAGAAARGAVRSVKVDGSVAHMVVAVPYKGHTLIVKVRMRRVGDTWKVDEIENLASVLKQAGY
jgi:hypothetical protein